MAEPVALEEITAAYPNGDFYKGTYNPTGARHGKGLYIWSNGNRYEGDWVDGKKHGQGKYTFPSGNYYEGAWESDEKHGYGVFQYKKSGNRYEGEWARNKKEGSGKYHFGQQQQWFVGTWQNDQFHGPGTLYQVAEDGGIGEKICDGEWVDEDGGLSFVQQHA